MSTRKISLESKQIELDGKISNLLEKTHVNSQTLIDIKSMFFEFLGKLKDECSPHLEPKFTCEEQQASLHDTSMVPKKTIAIHDVDPLDTSIGGSGNEVSAHSLSRGKNDLGCLGGSNSSTLQIALAPSKNLGIESTLPHSTPRLQSLEGVDWIVLQPKSFPSKKLSSKKRVIGFKSLMKCGVECQTSHTIGHVSRMTTFLLSIFVNI